MSRNLRSAVNQAKGILTTELKRIIQRVGAVRTGNMLASAEVDNIQVIQRGSSFSIDIDLPGAVEYLVYVSEGTGENSLNPSLAKQPPGEGGIEPRRILDLWTGSQAFQDAIGLVVDGFYRDYLPDIERSPVPQITDIFISGFEDSIKTV